MNVESFSEIKAIATRKWHEYKEASKKSKNPVYKDLQKVYNQIKGGKKVTDIFKVIQKGGMHDNGHPKLAIAQATTKKIFCEIKSDGSVHYINTEDRWGGIGRETVKDVLLEKVFQEQKQLNGPPEYGRLRLSAPVPLIPPQFLPSNLSDDYYILWEVDEWKMVPPTDPYLLKRITKTLFVVLAAWDLTPLEKAVMAGRMYK